MIEKCDLSKVRENMSLLVGEKIVLKMNKGRKKIAIEEGILENTYPSVFVVNFGGSTTPARRVSYSYTDVLTHAVEFVQQ